MRYKPRKTIKSQALADFVDDLSPNLQTGAGEELLQFLEKTSSPKWTVCTDGASNANGARL